ncbi:GNAT family N-acetyltransferase [Leptobacterium flavescens]|uniref:GNAT family N-acetyltransferase n=1 Tax=Leptobacterium flavescens TaxID=472055 RepID=A0A6P0UTR2_9FLAO|nr:GNAT family N-acetyltransferase [Leptobacterium flavescens]NER15229.1 GNAT family N-acetyltransferase [Leptobacterium flavescens]
MGIHIRKADFKDYDQIWEIFREVIRSGDTYVFDPDTPEEELEKHWFAPYMETFVAEKEGEILGTYVIKPNQIGLGSHIANCSYMVHPDAHGQGIGKTLCEHSIDFATGAGYKAMQFNIVVSTNKAALKLWEKFGFRIIGTIPEGFKHRELGYVDAHILYRKL